MMRSRPDAVYPVEEPADGSGGEPLTESDAEEHIHGICFKTGPPGPSAGSTGYTASGRLLIMSVAPSVGRTPVSARKPTCRH